MIKKKKPFENISRMKKTAVGAGLAVSLLGGMILIAETFINSENYYHPYIFNFTFGVVGLLAGLLAAEMLKPTIVLNRKMQENYFIVSLIIGVGFTGLVLLATHIVNTKFSTKEKCNNYPVIDKIFIRGGYKKPESHILIIKVDGIYHTYYTNQNYWQTVPIGQEINACVYKGRIGFNYLKLTNEN